MGMRSGLAATATLAMIGGLAPSAEADVRVAPDRVGDARVVADIASVRIQYATYVNLAARYRGSLRTTQTITWWLDTAPRNQGPEYRITVRPNSEGPRLIRVDRWRQTRGDAVRCPRLEAYADIFASDPVTTLRVPGACLRGPASVRMAVRFLTSRADRSYADWVPRVRLWSRFVDRY